MSRLCKGLSLSKAGLFGLLLALALPCAAQKVKEPAHPLDDLVFAKDELWVTVQPEDGQSFAPEVPAAVAEALERLRALHGRGWTMRFDRVTGRPALLEGPGLPWIPGTANRLTSRDLGLKSAGLAGKEIPVETVAQRARDFLRENPGLSAAAPEDLVLNRVASGPVLDYLYWVEFDWSYHGIPVDRAGLSFRLNHGNLVQVGQDFVSDAILALDPTPELTRETAWQIVRGYAGVEGDAEVVEPGRLLVLPVSRPEVLAGDRVPPGAGLRYRLAYELSFRLPGGGATWQARVDAHTGELLSFLDANAYGHIQGGVHLTDGFPADSSMPFPYANYSGTTGFADVAGNFSGTSGTTTLVGDLVRITDYCGSISQASDGAGLINLGSNTGTDCSTPGNGGAGNTRAARTQYWHVTQIKIKALTYMPANNWLSGQLLDRTNMTSAQSNYCPGNAFWDGTNLNFCVSGGGYGNTGELPGVSLHEWGHGMDSNDGKAPADKGTGETYGDFSGALQTHQSCIGAGFAGSNCSGYGDSCKSCKGVRDIDWAAHQSGAAHTPFDLDDSSGYRCSQYGWPYTSYPGACRYEGHCESYISSEACWDLAVRDLPAMGIDTTTAWQIMDRLWYASRPTAQGAYTCTATNPTGAVTAADGSNAGSLYNIFRAVDDCDGDLTNGTPHAAAIFAALNRHSIAVGLSTDATNQNQASCCPTLTTPSLSGSAASCQNNLSWGAVTNATRYSVYRNETSCTAGFTLIATVSAPSVTYADANVSAGTAYYYRIQALTASDACASAMSNCATVTAATCSGTCTAPGAPTLTAAAAACGSVDLTWTAGTGTTASYNVYRTGGACGSGYAQIAGPVAATTYSDTTATAGTTYGYMVRGSCSSSGSPESANSNCRTAAALATPTAPAAPTVTDDCSGLIVSWTADPAAASYDVYRRTGGCGNNAWGILQSGVTGTSWPDATATSGSTYGYYIVSVNSCGTATDGKNACGAGTHTASGAPAAPTGLTATGACASVNLAWTASPGATSYNVLRTTNTNCSTGLAQIGTSATASYSDTTAATGTTYYYVVQAVSGCGTSANSGCANAARLTAAAAPTGLTATGTCTSVDLSWTASTGATSYNVLRTTNANCSTGLAQIGTSTTPSYGDTTAAAGTPYYYVVQAVNTCGTSASSSCANAARLAAPAAPTGLTATGTCTSVDLAWTASSGATSYNVLRTTNANCSTGLAQIGTSATASYGDTTATAGTPYYYVVQAANTCGTSANSSCANAARLALPAAPAAPTFTSLSCTTLTVNWTAVAGAAQYDLYRRAGACGTGSLLASNLSGTSYPDSGLTASTQYSYYLVAKNGCGSSAAGTCASVTTTGGPTAPNAPSVADDCTGLALSWPAVSGATTYNIYRRANGCGTNSWTTAASGVATASWTDTGATLGNTYGYYVEAVNACGTATSGNAACTAGTHSLAAPAAPGSVAATGSCADVTVTWGAVSGATSYDLLRGAACGTATATFSGVTSPYHDTTAVAGTTYQYWVVASNACGTSGPSSCAASARLVSPIPTISGGTANTCPSATVALSTETGMTNYQWYRNASALGGANASTYSAGSSGTYTVSYTGANGCTGTSAGHAVTITPCAPNIVYAANGPWSQVSGMGNGDTVVDPGETWDVTVTLQNSGNSPATAVQASLSATGATFCTATGSYGSLAAAATASATFRFVAGTGFTCGDSLSFNVVNKMSVEGSYADQSGAFTKAVGALGSGTPETATTANFSLPVNATTTRDLSPALTTAAASASAASATYTATANSNKVSSALLRHLASGATVALNVPTGNNIPATTDVTAFYQAHGPGTYQMQWTTGNGQAATLTAISLSVTPVAAPVCNLWSGLSCLAGPTPKPVPDGQWVSGSPSTASKVDAAGDQLTLGWDVSCPSSNYNILYGNGSAVSAAATSGGACAIGTSGSYTWNASPAIPSGESFVWWVIVGTDGSATEGSWGKRSDGAERNGSAASNRCGYTLKNTTGTCP